MRATHARTPPTTPSAPDPAAEEVRRNFFELFPQFKGLEKLSGDKLDGLLSLLDREPQREAQFQHYWSTFGRGSLRALGEQLAPIFGGQPEAIARRFIDAAFLDWLEHDQEAQARFFEHDPTLPNEFTKKFEASVLEPIRRSTLAQEQERAAKRMRLPSANPRTAVPANGQPKKKLTGDELHEAAAEKFFSGR